MFGVDNFNYFLVPNTTEKSGGVEIIDFDCTEVDKTGKRLNFLLTRLFMKFN